MIRTLKFKLNLELIPSILSGSVTIADLVDLLFRHLCVSEGEWNPLESGETREVEILALEIEAIGKTDAEKQFLSAFVLLAIEKTKQKWTRHINQPENPLLDDSITILA